MQLKGLQVRVREIHEKRAGGTERGAEDKARYVRWCAAPHAASSPTARTARSTHVSPTRTPIRIRANGKGMTYGSGRHDLRHVAHVGKLKRWQPRVGDGGADNTSSRQNPSRDLARKLTPPCWASPRSKTALWLWPCAKPCMLGMTGRAHLKFCPSADPPQHGTRPSPARTPTGEPGLAMSTCLLARRWPTEQNILRGLPARHLHPAPCPGQLPRPAHFRSAASASG